MALKEYYQDLGQTTPQQEFRKLLARECGVTELAVYRWLSGEVRPHKLKQEKIAELTGKSIEELFPTEKQN